MPFLAGSLGESKYIASAIALVENPINWYMNAYGNMGCWVFKRGGTKLERFLPKNNILKVNYSILRIGLVGASEVFKNQSFTNQLFSFSHSPN